jgi:hypothetical protein
MEENNVKVANKFDYQLTTYEELNELKFATDQLEAYGAKYDLRCKGKKYAIYVDYKPFQIKQLGYAEGKRYE